MATSSRCPEFQVTLNDKAGKQYEALKDTGRPEAKRVARIQVLLAAGHIPDGNAIPLVGILNSYRYRAGRLRVVYTVDLIHCAIVITQVTLGDESTYRD